MRDKITRVIEGYNMETYNKKYGFLFNKHKLCFFDNKEDLEPGKEYWLIDGKYYETSKVTHKKFLGLITGIATVALALTITIPIVVINTNKKTSHFEPLKDEEIHKHVSQNERKGYYTLSLKNYLYGDETIQGKLREGSVCSDDRYFLDMQDFKFNYDNKTVDFSINLLNKNKVELPQIVVIGNFSIELFCLKGSQTIWSETISDLDITFTLDSEATYNIENNITNGILVGKSVISTRSTTTLKIVPDYGYKLPLEINATGADFDYNNESGEIIISNPISDITINAQCDEIFFNITATVINGTSDLEEESVISKIGSFDIKIMPEQAFNFPDYIEVSGAQYTYNKTTGDIHLFGATKDVEIKATCIGTPFSITNDIGNGKYHGPGVIYGGTSEECTIDPDDGFTYPAKEYIIVINATITNYDQTNGKLIISNPSGEVKIKTTCPSIND